jgi:hypothetical protein
MYSLYANPILHYNTLACLNIILSSVLKKTTLQ